MKSLVNLTLGQAYPRVSGDPNFNGCGDPACGNYGIEPAPARHAFVGRGAVERRLKATLSGSSLAKSVGRSKLEAESGDNLHRKTDAFEFASDPRGWNDGPVPVCQHLRATRRLLSNEAFDEERHRLWTRNGALNGPCCGNCGTGHLEKPEEFIVDDANGIVTRDTSPWQRLSRASDG